MKLHVLIFILLSVFPAFGQNISDSTEPQTQSKYAGKAIVYIYSPKTAKPPDALRLPVLMDGKEIGKIRASRYFIAVIPAGVHSFHLKNKRIGGVEINFEAGKTYYLRGVWSAGVAISLGGMMRAETEKGAYEVKQLRPVDESDIKNKEVAFTELPE